MQIPPADLFRPERDSGRPPRVWASVPDTGFDLYVPDCDPDGDSVPAAASLALAATVLADLDALRDAAVAHLARYVDAERLLLVGTPHVLGVSCDAGRARVELSLNWDSALYTLWTVAFVWHADGRRSPVELSVRPH
jgi:hypothetical protein